jgi:hypothetical protein
VDAGGVMAEAPYNPQGIPEHMMRERAAMTRRAPERAPEPERLATKDVIVVRGWVPDGETDDAMGRLARETGCLVVSLESDQSLETLDEDAMRAAGWIRAPS